MGFLFFISNVSVFFLPKYFYLHIEFTFIFCIRCLISFSCWFGFSQNYIGFFLASLFGILSPTLLFGGNCCGDSDFWGSPVALFFFFMFSVFLHLDLCTWGKVVIQIFAVLVLITIGSVCNVPEWLSSSGFRCYFLCYTCVQSTRVFYTSYPSRILS